MNKDIDTGYFLNKAQGGAYTRFLVKVGIPKYRILFKNHPDTLPNIKIYEQKSRS